MRVLLGSVLAILTLISCINAETSVPNPTTRPSEAFRSIPVADLGSTHRYWNMEWSGRASQLYSEIAAVNARYYRTQTYVPGARDCSDMTADIWEMLASKGIVSLIAAGNLEMERENFFDCNHVWLIVYSGEGSAAALEATSGRTHTWADTLDDGRLRQYWEGFIYEKPSDVSEDFAERW